MQKKEIMRSYLFWIKTLQDAIDGKLVRNSELQSLYSYREMKHQRHTTEKFIL